MSPFWPIEVLVLQLTGLTPNVFAIYPFI